jgi:PAS domain S-box-containing protein
MLKGANRESQNADPDMVRRESMERSQEGLLIIRPSRQIMYANRAAGAMLGRNSSELVNTVLAHPLTLGGLSRIIVPHGTEDPTTLEASTVTIDWEGTPAWLATLHDVTAPHRLQSMKSERVKVLERMAQGAALTDILIALVQFVESQYPQSICTVMLLDPDGLRLRYGASTQLPRALIEASDGIRVGPGQGSCGAAAYERRAVIATDIATDPQWVDGREEALKNGIHACWSMPIFSAAGGEVIGTFATYYRTPRGPATDEIELVSACAQVTGVAIERYRAEAQLKLLESSIAHLNDMVIITDASPIDEPGPRMVFVNDAVLKHTGYRREELLGKSPRLLQGPLTQRGELERIRNAIAARQPVRAELINYTRAGNLFWVELDITSISDDRGRVTHFVSVQRDITEYKRIESAMRSSEERFRLVARITTDVIWDWNLQTGELWRSDGIQTLFGYGASELDPNDELWVKRVHQDDRDRVMDGIQAAIDGGKQSWHDEYRFLRGDGTYAHVIDKGFITHDEAGRPVRMVGGMKDVSERHLAEADARRTAQTQSLIIRAQRQIAESELDLAGVMQLIAQRAQELAGASGAAIVSAEGDALFYRAVSGSTYHHLGLRFNREHSLAGTALREYEAQICDDTEDDPRVDQAACLAVGARSLMCVPLNRQDVDSALLTVISGRTHAFDARDLANLQILADSLGSALQRERNAEQLQKSESKYRLLFDSNPQPMLVYDVHTLGIMAVNAAAVAHYGYAHDEFLRMSIRELHPPDELVRLDNLLKAPLRHRRHADRWRHCLKGGAVIDVEISSDDMMFEGCPARLVLATDVTQRLQADARLRDQASLLDKTRDAIVAGDLDHRITFWNKGAERLYGWTADEILGVSNIEDVYPDPGIVKEILAGLLGEGEWNGRLQQRRKDGRIIEVEAHSTLIRDDEGAPRLFLVVASEVDPRWNSGNRQPMDS